MVSKKTERVSSSNICIPGETFYKYLLFYLSFKIAYHSYLIDFILSHLSFEKLVKHCSNCLFLAMDTSN